MDPRNLFLNHYAFLVGIDEYDHFPRLQGAHSDATTLRDALHWVGYPAGNVLLVSPENTALGALKREVDNFLNRLRYQDSNPNILVFWAGHGVPTERGSFLVTRSTKKDSANWDGYGLALGRLADWFMSAGPSSLMMFFDVCHSFPEHLDDLEEQPRELILARMKAEVRTTFVGVSTFAYEIPVWTKARETMANSAGILADAIQKAVHGESCDSDDKENCHDDDFAVTDRRLADKLEAAVIRKARAAGVHQQLAVLAHHVGPSRKIGFAVRSFAEARLNELSLPVEADLLARLVVDRMGPYLDHLTVFGVEMVRLVRDLIDRSITKENFLRKEQRLAREAILELKTDQHLGFCVYLLLYCREEAKRDDTTKKILQKLYNHLISGGSAKSLGEWLDNQYRMFAFRQSLPCSYGIRVLADGHDHGYASIIDPGAPIAVDCDAKRTFVTTAPLQKRARLDVWRADNETSITRDLDEDNICFVGMGRFATELGVGSRVWVKLGIDEQGCQARSCEVSDLYVSMKILLGREGQRGCDWGEHWHLEFGEGWPDFHGDRDSSEPSWVEGLRCLMDECRRSLEELLADVEGVLSQYEDDRKTVFIKWLHLAEMVIYIRDSSKLAYTIEVLIAALRDRVDQSMTRLSWALRNTMSSDPGGGPNGTNDQPQSVMRRKDVNAILGHYELWQAGSPAVRSGVLTRAELLALLLQAVMAEGSERGPAVEKVVELVRAMGPEEANEKLGEVVGAGAPPAPQRANAVVARLVVAVGNFLQEEGASLSREQQEMLRKWAQFADDTLKRGQAETALDRFIVQLTPWIGMASLLLVRVFKTAFKTAAAGAVAQRALEFNELVERLRGGGDQSSTRELAEQIYRLLQEFQLDQLREHEADPAEGTAILLVFNAVLYQESTAMVLQVLTKDVDWKTGLRVVAAFADPDRPNLVDMIRADAGRPRMIQRMAVVDSVMRGPIAFADQARAAPERRTRGRVHQHPEEHWHDPTLLAVPPGERLAPAQPVGDQS